MYESPILTTMTSYSIRLLYSNVACAELISKKYLILFHAHLYAVPYYIKQY